MKKFNILLIFILALAFLAILLLFQDRAAVKKAPFTNYPFFLSTKFATSNIRSGPGQEFPIVWVYKEKAVPFKVLASYKDWYQIENYDGGIGWIFKNTTSSAKYAIAIRKLQVYLDPNKKSNKLAIIDKGVIVKLLKKNKEYVKVYLPINNVKVVGWVLASDVWGEL